MDFQEFLALKMKQKNSELNFSKFPDLIGTYMWENLDIPDILNLATNTRHGNWFRYTVIVPPTDFAVFFVSSQRNSRDHYKIQMTFKDRPKFVWYLYPTLRNLEGAKMMLNISGHKLLSKEVPSETEGEKPVLHSFAGDQKTIIEILDWLAIFFRFELTNIMIGTKGVSYDVPLDWAQLLRAKDVLISDCQDSYFITEFLKKRHERGLRTLIEFVEIGRPRDLTVECLSSLDYLSARINFTRLDTSYFIDYIRLLLQRNVPNFHILRARIQPWTMEQVLEFKNVLGLEDSGRGLSLTHRIRNHYSDFNDRSRMFQIQKDENTIFAFYFLLGEEDMYTMMAVAAWLKPEEKNGEEVFVF